MADPFAMNDGSDDGFESVSKSDLLTPTEVTEQQQADSTTPAAAVKEEDVDLLLTTTDDPSDKQADAEIKNVGMQGEHDLVTDDIINDKQSVDDDIDNDNDDDELNVASAVAGGVLSEQDQAFTEELGGQKQDLLLDFGSSPSSPMESELNKVQESPVDDLMDDLTPVAPEQSVLNSGEQFAEREATPPPSPQPSSVKEPEQLPVKEPEHIPVMEPEVSSVMEPEVAPVKEPEYSPVKEPEYSPVKEPEFSPVEEPESSPVEEKEPEAVIPTEPVPELKPAAPPATAVADSTTHSNADDGPVKMPKATTIPAPSRTAPHCRTSGCAWLKDLDPRVWELLLWRDPKFTGPVLGFLIVILLSMTCCSVFSVTSYLLLFILLGALIVRVVRHVMAKVHTGDNAHPFQPILDADVTVSEQAAEEFVQSAIPVFNQFVSSVRDLLLVQDIISSLKFGLVLYAATYIGAWFNGLTVIILVTVGAFTLPKVYEVNKAQIDHYVDIVQSRFDDYYKQLQDKVPFLKKQKTQ